MRLLYQTHSPFARKTLVFAYEAGIAGRIEVIHQETSPTRRNEAVFAENPLGKVPVLIRPGCPSLFDSDVICAHLDTEHDGRKPAGKDFSSGMQEAMPRRQLIAGPISLLL